MSRIRTLAILAFITLAVTIMPVYAQQHQGNHSKIAVRDAVVEELAHWSEATVDIQMTVFEGDYAISDWMQNDMAGVMIFKRIDDDKWTLLFGENIIPPLERFVEKGVPENVAIQLTRKFNMPMP